MSSYFREQLEEWLKTIDVKADCVLDVGGAQLPVKDRVRTWEVKEKDYKILDLENPHKGEKPDIVCDLNNVDDIHTCHNNFPDCWNEPEIKHEVGVIYENSFDVIFCLEVMEYIWNPYRSLKNINWFMRKDGILYISFPFIYPHHNPEGKDYLRYTRWGVEKLLKEAGFEIEEIVTRLASKEGGFILANFFGTDRMRPSKQYQGHNEVGYLVKARKV